MNAMAFAGGPASAFPWLKHADAGTVNVFVRLAVVHATALMAYGNLLRLRGRPILSCDLFFYTLIPLGPLAWHAFAGSLLTLVLFYEHDYGSSPNTKDLRRALLWTMDLNPELREDHVQPDDLLEGNKETEPEREPPRRSFWHVITLMLLPTIFTAQCGAIIILYLHRWWHGALTFTDQRIFELGCSGLVTTLHWTGLRLDHPLFRRAQPHPDSRLHRAKSEFDGLLSNLYFFPTAYNRTVLLYLPAFFLCYRTCTLEILITDRGYTYAAMAVIATSSAMNAEFMINGQMTPFRQAPPREKRKIVLFSAIMGALVIFMVMADFMPLYIMVMGGLEVHWGIQDLKTSPVDVVGSGLWGDDFGRWAWPFA